MSEPREDELQEQNETRPDLIERLLLLPSVLGFVVSLAIVIAVSHDVAYFWYIDIDYLSILTTSDLLKSTASWLPVVAIFGIFPFLTGVIFGKSAHFINFYATEKVLSRSTLNKFWLLIKNNLPYTIFFLSVLYLVLFNVSYQYSLALFAFFIAAMFAMRLLNRLIENKSRIIRSKYADSSILLVFFFMIGLVLGWVDGASDLSKTSPAYRLRSDGIDFSLIVLIRAGEKGVIYKQGDNVGFLPWDNIKGLSRIIRAPAKVNILTKIYRWFSSEKPPAP